MRVLRWGFGIVVIAGVLALFAAWIARVRLIERGRRELEAVLADVFEVPTRIGALDVTLLPVRVGLRDVRVGTDQPTLAVGSVTLRIHLLASLRAGQAIGSLSAAQVFFDPDRLPSLATPTAPSEAPSRIVPFRIAATSIDDVTVQFPVDDEGQVATATTAHVTGSVGMSAERPYVSFTVDGSSAELRRADRRLAVKRVHLDAGVKDEQFFVHEWTIDGDALRVRAVNEALPPATRHRVTAELPFAELGVVFEPLSEIAGRVRAEATLRGELFDPEVEAAVELEQARIHGLLLGDLRGTFTRRGRELSLTDVLARQWGGAVDAAFQLSVGDTAPVRAEASWRDVNLALVAHPERADAPWRVPSDGTATLTGTLNPIALTIAGTSTIAAQAAEHTVPAATVEATVTLTDTAVSVEATAAQGSANRARLAATRSAGDTVSGHATIEIGDAAKLAPLTPPPLRDGLSGALTVQAQLAGTLAQPLLSGDVYADRFTMLGATLPRVRGRLAWSGSELRADSVSLVTETGTARVDGRIAMDSATANDWRVATEKFDASVLAAAADFLATAWPLRGGTLDGTASCRGPWPTPEIDANMQLRRTWLFGEPIAELVLRGSMAGAAWRGELEVRHGTSDRLTVNGEGQGRDEFTVTLHSTPWDLAGVRSAGDGQMHGEVALDGEIRGPLDRLGGRLRVNGRGLARHTRVLGDVSVAAEGQDGTWTAATRIFGDTLQLDAEWRTRDAWPFSLTGRWQALDLASLVVDDPDEHIETTGTLTLAGPLADLDAVRGELRVDHLSVRRHAYELRNSEPVVVSGEAGRFRIRGANLSGNGTRLHVSGDLTVAGRVDLTVAAAGDLTFVELLVDPIHSARGSFDLSVRIRRAEAGPWDLQGRAALADAAVDVGLPVAPTKVSMALTLRGSRIDIDACSGRIGGGDFQVGGAVDLQSGPELTWLVEQVALDVVEGLEARVSGRGTVAGPWDAVVVAGDVAVINALYSRNVGLADLLPWLREQLFRRARVTRAESPIRLDLRLHAPGGIFIDNNVAKAELRLDLTVTGPAHAPVVLGTVQIVDARVTFNGRELIVSGGTIDFRDRFEINPVLNLSADTQIATPDGEYTVTVSVAGTANEPRVRMQADDASLSQNDVASLLLFGKTGAQLQRDSTELTPGSALTLVPTGAVGERLGGLIGVDRFEVEAVQGRTAGSIEPRISIGKDLTERLRTLVSSSLGTEARQLVQLEYRVTRDVSLVGSWESASQADPGAWGGDVKFRYEFRRVPLSLGGGW